MNAICQSNNFDTFCRTGVRGSKAVPGAVVAIQTFGDFPLRFHPHMHILVSDGCFHENNMFSVSSIVATKTLGHIFRHNVLKMLLKKDKVTQDMIALLDKWRHSGFNVFSGPRILPGQKESMENLARYINRASFSQGRVTYIPHEAKVIYHSKDGKEEKIFDALEWLAAMCSHVPNKGDPALRDYYGHCSPASSGISRGRRKNNDQDELIPSILEPDGTSKAYRRNWARLIQKIYELDPLTCPRCTSQMRVISVIEQPEIIKKILKLLGLWEANPPKVWLVKARPPPKRANAPSPEIHLDYSHSQVPLSEDHLVCHPDYPIETYALS